MKTTKSSRVLQKWSRTRQKQKRKSQRRTRAFQMMRSVTSMIPMKRYRGPHWVWFNIVSTSIKHTKIRLWTTTTFQIRSRPLLRLKMQIRKSHPLRKRLESWKKTHIRAHFSTNRWTSIKVDRKVCFIIALYLQTRTTKVLIFNQSSLLFQHHTPILRAKHEKTAFIAYSQIIQSRSILLCCEMKKLYNQRSSLVKESGHS